MNPLSKTVWWDKDTQAGFVSVRGQFGDQYVLVDFFYRPAVCTAQMAHLQADLFIAALELKSAQDVLNKTARGVGQ